MHIVPGRTAVAVAISLHLAIVDPAHAAPPAAPAAEPPKGTGFIVSGAVTLTCGVGFMTGSLIALTNARDIRELDGGDAAFASSFFGVTLLAVGAPLLAVGASLLPPGVVRRVRWNRWRHAQRVSLRPSLGRGTHGTWTVSLALMF